jgi:hypothetical protein
LRPGVLQVAKSNFAISDSVRLSAVFSAARAILTGVIAILSLMARQQLCAETDCLKRLGEVDFMALGPRELSDRLRPCREELIAKLGQMLRTKEDSLPLDGQGFNKRKLAAHEAFIVLLKLGDQQSWDLVQERYNNYEADVDLWTCDLEYSTALELGAFGIFRSFWFPVFQTRDPRLFGVLGRYLDQHPGADQLFYPFQSGQKTILGRSPGTGTHLQFLQVLLTAHYVPEPVREWARQVDYKLKENPAVWDRGKVTYARESVMALWTQNRDHILAGEYKSLTAPQAVRTAAAVASTAGASAVRGASGNPDMQPSFSVSKTSLLLLGCISAGLLAAVVMLRRLKRY